MKEKIILSPIQIGPVTVKNRVMFPSMCTFFCDGRGYVTEDQMDFVEDLAKGGAGLIVVPGSPHGKPGRAVRLCPTTGICRAGRPWRIRPTATARSCSASSTRRRSRPAATRW